VISPPEGCLVPVVGRRGSANWRQPLLEKTPPLEPLRGRDPRPEAVARIFHVSSPSCSRLYPQSLGVFSPCVNSWSSAVLPVRTFPACVADCLFYRSLVLTLLEQFLTTQTQISDDNDRIFPYMVARSIAIYDIS